MNVKDKLMGAGVVILAVLVAYGYVMNIIRIATAEAFTGFTGLRIAGIFVAPMGVILGFVK